MTAWSLDWMATFWASLDPIWTPMGAIGTVATAAVAWYQIGSLKRQQQGWKTLEACERYEGDPVLHEVAKTLRTARDEGRLQEDPRPYRLEAIVLLNYFEGIATGEAQGFYNPKIVKEHLEPIIRDHVSEFLNPEMAERMGLNPTDFVRLRKLVAEWDKR